VKRILILLVLLVSGCGRQSLAVGTEPPRSTERIGSGTEPRSLSSVPVAPAKTLIAMPLDRKPVTATPQPLGDRSIYVIDPRNGDLVTQILVIDPDTQRVAHTLRVRYSPDIAVSPDGQLLYVADTYWTKVTRGELRDVLSVYDISAGTLLRGEVEIPGRLKHKIYPIGFRTLFLSHDGRRLFFRKYGDPAVQTSRLTVLDPDTFETLAEYPACANGSLWPLPDDQLVCVGPSGIEAIDPLTGATLHRLTLPPSQPATPVIAQAGHRVYLVTRDAYVTVVDFTASSPQVIADRVALNPPPGSVVGYNHPTLDRDGSRLYLGLMSGEHRFNGLADEIWAFDTRTWTRLGVFKPTIPAFHLAVSADGHQLYAVNPFEKSLAIFDTAALREVAVMRELGDTPALIVVPPMR
jgi:hypothetical protein